MFAKHTFAHSLTSRCNLLLEIEKCNSIRCSSLTLTSYCVSGLNSMQHYTCCVSGVHSMQYHTCMCSFQSLRVQSSRRFTLSYALRYCVAGMNSMQHHTWCFAGVNSMQHYTCMCVCSRCVTKASAVCHSGSLHQYHTKHLK